MFIVGWDSPPPPDRAEWIELLRDVLAGELGSYRVVFRESAGGWRFRLEWKEEAQAQDDVIANSPEGVAYNIFATLADHGKPVDSTWKPGADPP